MTRPNRLALAVPLIALLGLAGASCNQFGPLAEESLIVPPEPHLIEESRSTRPEPVPPEPEPAPATTVSATMPGDGVKWTPAPALRAAPAGVKAFLADVESHLPPEMGLRYRDRDLVTWCHETTHGIHAGLRNRYGVPAFYPGGGRCALVRAPAVTLGDVAAVLPQRFRGSRFNLYLVSQRGQWDREPLYVWDEWVAYDNGTTTGIEEGARLGVSGSDDAIACIEFSGYALGVAAAARRRGVQINPQFREFLAWELRRSLGLYARAMAMPAFSWPDRRLERLWRGGDAFLVEELRALYGDSLTVKDLLP